MTNLRELYISLCGCAPAAVVPIAAATGSNRAYYRLTDARGQTMIGVVGTDKEENAAFIYLARHFARRGLPVPEVYAVSADGMCYLQQDLGTTTLYDALATDRAEGHYTAPAVALLTKTLQRLAALQWRGDKGLDYRRCYPVAAFDTTSVLFDLNYFKYCFLKPSGIAFHEVRLEEDFRRLAAALTHEPLQAFMYRDCQARNVMLVGADEPYFIDFQGGRRGPCYYDLVSFLWQASAHYDAALRLSLSDEYYAALREYTAVPPREEFRRRVPLFALFRTLQVLGAYGFRGLFERKPYFIKSIPYALDNLRVLLQENEFPYPWLVSALSALAALPQYAPRIEPAAAQQLVVTVVSFAYKYGLPVDASGNGGGYIFDCRGTFNPGRVPQYRALTGLDAPVQQCIAADGSLPALIANAYPLAEAHIDNYLARGFSNLMIAFGCTGGQHRSVYAAEQMAAHIKEKYGIEVHILHRELNINKVL